MYIKNYCRLMNSLDLNFGELEFDLDTNSISMRILGIDSAASSLISAE